MIVRWINRLITHNRDTSTPPDFGIRVVIHIPAGFLMGLGILSRELFEFYERNEDAHHKDEAWKDVFGGMVGYIPGRLCRYALMIWAAIWILEKL